MPPSPSSRMPSPTPRSLVKVARRAMLLVLHSMSTWSMLNKSLRRASWFCAGIVTLCAAFTMFAQQPAKVPEPAPAPEANKPPEYVGSETCKACHEEIYNNLQKTPHFAIETGARRGWKERACESCHGPGSKHADSASADDIKNPAKLSPEAQDHTCLT